MNGESMLKPALIGGVALGIVSAIPIIGAFNCLCCAWVLAGGMLAAHLYVKDAASPVTLGRGAVLGLATGALGAVVCTLFSIPLHMMSASGGGMNFMAQIQQQIDKMPNVPPETRQALEALASRGDLTAVLLVGSFILSLVVFSIFGMMGATIGVALFEKRKIGTPPSHPTSYQPPSQVPPPPME